MAMRAARLEAVGRMRVVALEPPAPARGEALIRVEACGICGTDRHIYRGEYAAALPLIPGHEFAGTVAAVGEGSRLTPGERVAVDPNIACGICAECRRGEPCLCPARMALGVDLDGGLAEFVVIPDGQAYPLPDGMPATWGALCEPLACCLRALDRAEIRPGTRVVVLGGGVIGQMLVRLATLAGATVVMVTRQAGRRALAERSGAAASYDPGLGDLVTAVAGAGGLCPGGADVVFECAGVVETFEQAIALARKGGTVVIVGVAPADAVARVRPFDLFAKELRLMGSYLNPLTHGRAVELAASGKLDLASLITGLVGLEETPALLESPPAPDTVKILVLP
ncbi:MAG TPA: alcohol dehydrogenase catalytic domain-containing protein [Chloroflexota bacterium]|nr:alcohol dehydrogenase catalytic domain-containing protein [Chloroflexota bacterium]